MGSASLDPSVAIAEKTSPPWPASGTPVSVLNATREPSGDHVRSHLYVKGHDASRLPISAGAEPSIGEIQIRTLRSGYDQSAYASRDPSGDQATPAGPKWSPRPRPLHPP